jgi:mannose-6-phosphate isomerase-like protein (cupin superfamily)
MVDKRHGGAAVDPFAHVSPVDVPEVSAPDDALVMRALVRRAEHGDDVSVTWVRLDGRHRRLHTDRSTRVYYVLEGSASFRLGEEQEVEVVAGDTVVVRRGTSYEFEGAMTYLVINGPAFRDGDDVYD